MKKAILSPLASAFVVPGMGQILNGQLKKGVCILGINLGFFVAGVITLTRIVNKAFKETHYHGFSYSKLLDKLRDQDFLVLWCLLTAFAILWLYAVLDAFLAGKKLDRLEKEEVS